MFWVHVCNWVKGKGICVNDSGVILKCILFNGILDSNSFFLFLFCLSDKEPGAEYNEWHKFFHASLILNIFLQLTFISPLLLFNDTWCSQNGDQFLETLFGWKGDFQGTYEGELCDFCWFCWVEGCWPLTEAGQCLDYFFYSLLWSLNTPLFCGEAQHLKKLQINLFLLTPLPLLP